MDYKKLVFDAPKEMDKQLERSRQMSALFDMVRSTRELADSSIRQVEILEEDYKLAVQNADEAKKESAFARKISIAAISISAISLLVAILELLLLLLS